ncbi:MAG: glutamine-hydrolyzing carbamoyl-phosphate synthase small subunit [Chloroflexi bacterium]|nr:glutamine-hydrolyzing carbamoyl-phosphate synthase small subunit [Chloroflexota bacterium]MDA1240428.1 glutamine-hydrolyzing carbamoyl-phosphate synthase small subunit [Chloroflexota bacterium]
MSLLHTSERPPALLVLADGRVFAGVGVGAAGHSDGEVVFSTSMTGYQEALTDPSFRGQILTMTFPLQGNYGTNASMEESATIQVRGFVVREMTDLPSHWRSIETLHAYLERRGIPGIAEVDTRALTRHLRSRGVVMGTITRDETAEQALARLQAMPDYATLDYVAEVSTDAAYDFEEPNRLLAPQSDGSPPPHIVVLDLGVKRNIMRLLRQRGCQVTAVPHTTDAETILSLRPDGVLLSPGPGDPMLLDHVTEATRGLIGRTPIMGICLGHQVIGRVFGASSYKLKFGHRGANHPVRDEITGKVYITSQNHGFAVDGDHLDAAVQVTQLHLNDGTVEGLQHTSEPVFTIQYHSEASPGPNDTEFLFDRFMTSVRTLRESSRGGR